MTCRVVHSLPLRMSVVQIFQAARMVAVSHLIGTEQLPTDVSDRVRDSSSGRFHAGAFVRQPGYCAPVSVKIVAWGLRVEFTPVVGA